MGAENKELDEELEDENLENNNEEEENQDESGADDGKEKEDTKEKTFSQSQVKRMMAREKKQGKSSVYKELGIDPKDTKMVAMFKAFVESQKTEEQKAAEKSAEEQSKIKEAENRAMIAELKAEAMMMGVKAEFVEDIVTLALSKMNNEEAEPKTIIGEFKKKYPMWFSVSSDDDSENKGQKGTGSSMSGKEKSKSGKGKSGLGERLAAQRKKQNTSAKSFWS